MKIKISINKFPQNGYLNIDPCPNIPEEYAGNFQIIQADYRNIDELVFDSECDEIIVEDVLDYIPTKSVKDNIICWAKKLRSEGTITIVGTDIEETMKLYFNRTSAVEDLNVKLYGEGDHPWHFKCGMTTLSYVTGVLKDLNLKITYRNFKDNKFIVTAKRG